MKLAGEAGSLLKLEEEVQEAIRKGQAKFEESYPLFHVTEYSLSEKPTEHSYHFVLGKVEAERVSFWDLAERLVLAALQDYAAYAVNGNRLQRKLFVEDVVHGFAFVDLCRQRFDVVLMNPPYGDLSAAARSYSDRTFAFSSHEAFCCFFQRAFSFLTSRGLVGSLTSRTFLTFSTFSSFRRSVISERHVHCVADLGFGVLDGAVVETAASVIDAYPQHSASLFIRLLKEDDKASVLIEAASSSIRGSTYLVSEAAFREVPGTPFCYWAGNRMRRIFQSFPSFANAGGRPTLGLVSADNDRFLRLRWETPEKLRRVRWNRSQSLILGGAVY
jgi:predicted RNA methylase